MALKDRFRRAVNRSQTTTRSNSSASSSGPSPTTPTLTLTKTTSRLSKRLTWGSRTPKEEKKAPWDEEMASRGLTGKHQEILKGFEWKWRSSMDGSGGGRNGSVFSAAISPGQSRVNSVDDTGRPRGSFGLGRRRSSAGSAVVGLERVRSGGKEVETIEE